MKTYVSPATYSSKKHYAIPCLAAMAAAGAAVGAVAGVAAKLAGGNRDYSKSPSIQKIKD